ncbi:MAG: RNA methyltransferase, partial [Bacillales bacterium]|nr:RNA methyltransferase [Bacillales bacterium]MDY5919629.1 RNA methyltransferase [Candidatus Enteromonas sp.]
TGAIHYVDVVSVTNLSRTIEALKRNGYWVIGTDGSAAKSIYEETYRYPVCLVVGSEGEGISRLVLEHCDIVAKIPMVGHVNSLNASVSAGISISAVRFVQKKN